MTTAFTGRKRIRRSFGRIPEIARMPNLIEVQKSSYDHFLQIGVAPEDLVFDAFGFGELPPFEVRGVEAVGAARRHFRGLPGGRRVLRPAPRRGRP